MKKSYTLFFTCFFILSKIYSQSTLDSGLVAYYPFNGNDSDKSVFGNHPTFNNATLDFDRFGSENSAYHFNGISNYMQIPNSQSLNTGSQITLCAWIKTTGFYYGLCHGNIVLQKGNTDNMQSFYTMRYSDLVNNCGGQAPDTLQEKFYGYNTGTSPQVSDNIQKDRWNFVVISYDGTYSKIYINGRLKNTNYPPGTTFGNSDDLFIGKMFAPQYPYWLNGSLDDIRIYNRALTKEEVRKLFTEEPSANVVGNVYVDNNADGIKDSLDYDASYTKVKLSNGDFVFTDYDGNYAINIDSVGIYSISIDSSVAYNPIPAIDTIDVNSLDTTIIKDFRLTLTPNAFDSVYVKIIPLLSAARPGFAYPCVINYVNTGNTIINVTNNFFYDTSILKYDSSSSIGVIKNWNVLSTTSNQMLPGQRNVFIAYFTILPTAHLGDSVKLFTTASSSNASSRDSVFARIRGSYDPNDKEATPELTTQEVAQGKYITYTIRFENTGTDTAFKVVVVDNLNSFINASSIQIVKLSHPCSVQVNDNKVIFTFKNINLPDKQTDFIGAHGFVTFMAKPLSTISAGTIIPNNASIYFDYNLPIVTNTANTIIKNPVITPVVVKNYQVSLTKNNNGVQADNYWVVSSEINCNQYNVQKSFDGVTFNNIGIVKAINKGQYKFSNQLNADDLKQQVLYYRLQIIDNNSRIDYSEIRKVYINPIKNNTINIFPNPANKEVVITRNSNNVENLYIINISGKIIKTIKLTSSQQIINVSDLASGMYLLQLSNGNLYKFIKE